MKLINCMYIYVCMRGVGELRDDVSFYISNEFFIAIYI